MHGSKGLEFDIVFALGVSCATVKDEETGEESNAEKLRQMYVALTRAKLRLYIPIEASRKKEVEETRKSPLALFWGRSKLEENPEEIIAPALQKNPAIGFSRLGEEQRIPADEAEEKIDLPEPPRFEADIPSRFIYSYSALARPKESKPLPPLAEGIKNLHTLPRGADTGAALHRIFERWFLEGMPSIGSCARRPTIPFSRSGETSCCKPAGARSNCRCPEGAFSKRSPSPAAGRNSSFSAPNPLII